MSTVIFALGRRSRRRYLFDSNTWQ